MRNRILLGLMLAVAILAFYAQQEPEKSFASESRALKSKSSMARWQAEVAAGYAKSATIEAVSAESESSESESSDSKISDSKVVDSKVANEMAAFWLSQQAAAKQQADHCDRCLAILQEHENRRSGIGSMTSAQWMMIVGAIALPIGLIRRSQILIPWRKNQSSSDRPTFGGPTPKGQQAAEAVSRVS